MPSGTFFSACLLWPNNLNKVQVPFGPCRMIATSHRRGRAPERPQFGSNRCHAGNRPPVSNSAGFAGCAGGLAPGVRNMRARACAQHPSKPFLHHRNGTGRTIASTVVSIGGGLAICRARARVGHARFANEIHSCWCQKYDPTAIREPISRPLVAGFAGARRFERRCLVAESDKDGRGPANRGRLRV